MKALVVILMALMFSSCSGRSQLDFMRKSKKIFNEFAEKAPALLQEIGELFYDPDFYSNITSCNSEKFPDSYGRKIEYSDFVNAIEASFECM